MTKFFYSCCVVLINLLILSGLSMQVHAQSNNKIKVFGRVVDIQTGDPVEFTTISLIENRSISADSDARGFYEINLPKDSSSITLEFSRVGYKEATIKLRKPFLEEQRIDVDLANEQTTVEVVIRQSRLDYKGMIHEKSENLKYLPSISGGIEAALPSIALGTYGGSGGELSNQYNVRGGNYDENLVYVNDFLIYRPQLIRQGQQEGLSFPNPEMMNTMSFSSGGFEAQYGDRMSSVLDITYKLPDSLRSTVDISLLGGSAHIEGSKTLNSTDNRKFRYLVGARYKSTRYILSSLDVTGEYVPSFADMQASFIYDLSSDWQISMLLNHNRASYDFVPENRSTAYGGGLRNLRLTSEFEGQERDQFNTSMAGLNLTFLPDRKRNPYFLKFLVSAQGSNESETFDIIGDYRLSELETDLSSDNFGEEASLLGSGTQHEYARNFLNFGIFNVSHKGGIELGTESGSNKSHFVQWGIGLQYETFDDKLNEWERLDSAGYSLQYNPDSVLLFNVFKTENQIENYRLTAFLQDSWTIRSGEDEWQLNGGLRLNYNTLNEEAVLSPRAQVLFKPKSWNNDIAFKLAGGMYAQPPLYREMRRPDGILNTNVRAQKSVHLVGGFTYDFILGERYPKLFRFIAEAYYKDMWDLISYEIDNVKIRYSGENDAIGRVYGLDIRLNGELVPGAESWINLSLLRAQESLTDVQHIDRYLEGDEIVEEELDYVPRPTNQFLSFSMFLQDYLPQNENFKVHVQFTLGSGLPYGVRGRNKVVRNNLKFNTYHRTDIGFSALLWDQSWRKKKPLHPLRWMKSTWLSLEVFNLMDKSNTASVNWVKTILLQEYAVPNRLTGRRVNLRLRMEF